MFVGEHGGKSLVYTDTQTHAPNQERTHAHTNPSTNAFTQTRTHTHTREYVCACVRECERVFVSERVLQFEQEDIRTNTHTKAHTHNKLLNTPTHAHTNGLSHKHARRNTHTQPHTYLHTRTHTSLESQTYFSAYSHARAKVDGGREERIRVGRPARNSWLELKILSQPIRLQ